MSNDMVYEPDPNCPFCSSQIERATFAESGSFRAIYNSAPILPGHSLIIPKAHKPNILSLDKEEICEFASFAQAVTRFLVQMFGGDGFNWTIQDGASAGQTVYHLHMHLIPRTSGDLPHPGDWYPLLKQSLGRHIDDDTRPKITPEEMQKITQHLRAGWCQRNWFAPD